MKFQQRRSVRPRINRQWMVATTLAWMLTIFSVVFVRAAHADSVAISVDSISPNPATINETVTIKLSADATGETNVRKECLRDKATWSWELVSTEYQPKGGTYGTPPVAATITGLPATGREITVTAQFPRAGDWKLKVKVTADYTPPAENAPEACGAAWHATDEKDVVVNVKPIRVELNTGTFGGGKHTMKTATTFVSDGTADVRTPEVKKKAGTGIGSGPPVVALAYESDSEVCYTWEASPALDATYDVTPNVAAPGVDVKVKATATLGTTTLNYAPVAKTITGTSFSASFTTADKLPKKIANTTLSVDWQISYDNGTSWESLKTSSHKLFVTAGTPGGSAVTVKRMDRATTKGIDQDTNQKVADKLIPLVIPSPFGSWSINATGTYKLTTAWRICDAAPTTIPAGAQWGGDCISLATLTKLHLEMLGVTGSATHYVYACHKDWTALVDAGFETHPTTGVNLLQWYGGADPAPGAPDFRPNNYEACLEYNGDWYEGGIGAKFNSAKAVLHSVCDPNNPADNGDRTKARQYWAGANTVAVSYPAP